MGNLVKITVELDQDLVSELESLRGLFPEFDRELDKIPKGNLEFSIALPKCDDNFRLLYGVSELYRQYIGLIKTVMVLPRTKKLVHFLENCGLNETKPKIEKTLTIKS